MASEEFETGKVIWFENERGYGFIRRPNKEDLFVHWKNIDMAGYRTLEEGQSVEYRIGSGAGGRETALDVRIVDD